MINREENVTNTRLHNVIPAKNVENATFGLGVQRNMDEKKLNFQHKVADAMHCLPDAHMKSLMDGTQNM